MMKNLEYGWCIKQIILNSNFLGNIRMYKYEKWLRILEYFSLEIPVSI